VTKDIEIEEVKPVAGDSLDPVPVADGGSLQPVPIAEPPAAVQVEEAEHDTGDETAPAMSNSYDAEEADEEFVEYYTRLQREENEKARQQHRAARNLDPETVRQKFDARNEKNKRRAEQRARKKAAQGQPWLKPKKIAKPPAPLNAALREQLYYIKGEAARHAVNVSYVDIILDTKDMSKAEQWTQNESDFYLGPYYAMYVRQEALKAIRKVDPNFDFPSDMAHQAQRDARNQQTTKRAKNRVGTTMSPDHTGHTPGGGALTNEPTGEITQQWAIERHNAGRPKHLQFVPKEHRRKRVGIWSLVGENIPSASGWKFIYEDDQLVADTWKARVETPKSNPLWSLLDRICKKLGRPRPTGDARQLAMIAVMQIITKRDKLTQTQVENTGGRGWARLVADYERKHPDSQHVRMLDNPSITDLRNWFSDLFGQKSGENPGQQKYLFPKANQTLMRGLPRKDAA
jgi:hypothetical protein